MVKKTICSMALVAALIPFVQSASAQDFKGTPKPTIQDYGPFTDTKSDVKFKNTTTKPASGMCGNPAGRCLFYGGDFVFDPFYPPFLPNGLANETDLLVPGTPYGAAVWVPFTVPEGETWEVTGLFTNNQSTYGVLDQAPNEPTAAAFWSINEGVLPGSAGTVVASGTSAATSTPTGRTAFSLPEYTVQVTGLCFDLTPGRYWMIVVPLCTNTADPFCKGVFFESDVEYINVKPKNAFGPPEPIDASFFDSPSFSFTFAPTYSAAGACGGFGCDAFSAGVLGRILK
jgi:hypothetical protein